MSANQYMHIKRQLPREVFKPYWPRLFPIFFLWFSGVASVVAVCLNDFPWYLNLGFALWIGYCWGIGGLLAHEIMHGAVVRSKKWQNFLGFFCLLPFAISPTFWRYWHNNLHHSHTQKIIKDPDAYPTLKIWKQSRFAQWMFPFTPGSGHKRSYFYFFFWFYFNAQVFQFYFRYRNKIFVKLDHNQVNLELAFIGIIHFSALVMVGPMNWLWCVFIPFAILNYIPFSYISTNHNLSPLTKENDPLANSLTVTNHPVLEFFHINFGYHVEHHLFPTLSGVHLKKVHSLLKKEHGDRLQVMPKWDAMKKLYSTARIYKNSKTLTHPFSGKTYSTIGVQSPAPKSENKKGGTFVTPQSDASRRPEI